MLIIIFSVVHGIGKPKKSKGGKKRSKHLQQTQQQGGMGELKRPKLEENEEDGLTGKDKQTLMKWKQYQQETPPFGHPIRMKPSGEGSIVGMSVHELQQMVQQQETVIKQQAVESEKLQRELQDMQTAMNWQMSSQKDRHAAIVLKCQVAGVSLPPELLNDPGVNINSFSTPSSMAMLSRQAASSSEHIISQSKSALLPQHPHTQLSTSSSISSSFPQSIATSLTPPPPPPFSSGMGCLLSYSNSTPSNHKRPLTSGVPLHAPPPQSSLHPHRPLVSIVPLSSTCNSLESVRGTQRLDMLPGVGGRVISGQLLPQLQQQQFMSPASSHGPSRMMLGDLPQYSLSQVDHLSSGSQAYPLEKKMQPLTSPILLDNLSFSPLTSSELDQLHNPSGLGGIFMGPSLMPLTENLDSILNITMPLGSGAGYGVGVEEEELSQDPLMLDLK